MPILICREIGKILLILARCFQESIKNSSVPFHLQFHEEICFNEWSTTRWWLFQAGTRPEERTPRKGREVLMIKKILVATDGSDHARRATWTGADMAEKYKARIFIVHVVPSLPRIPDEGVLQQINDTQQGYARQVLGEAEREIKEKGVEVVQSVILSGDPAKEIREFARKNNVDMIVMGSRGAGSVETLLMGSVSHRVCQLAECTCITVK
jgi:nucleotide-binding universal stress UspA family protein